RQTPSDTRLDDDVHLNNDDDDSKGELDKTGQYNGEKNQKKQKFASESSSRKEKVTFESTDYEAQPSSTDKTRRHEEWFTKDAYTNCQWVDKETSVSDWFNEMVDASKDPEDEE
ncbi:hypothetical protein Tco_1308596, partial [Tanacetum coccineum]